LTKRVGNWAYRLVIDLLVDIIFDQQYADGVLRNANPDKIGSPAAANRMMAQPLHLIAPALDTTVSAYSSLLACHTPALHGTPPAVADEPSLLFQNRTLANAKDQNPFRTRLSISKFFRVHLRGTAAAPNTAFDVVAQLAAQDMQLANNRQHFVLFINSLAMAQKSPHQAMDHLASVLLQRLTPLSPAPSYEQYVTVRAHTHTHTCIHTYTVRNMSCD
jgi:hypothetical protein